MGRWGLGGAGGDRGPAWTGRGRGGAAPAQPVMGRRPRAVTNRVTPLRSAPAPPGAPGNQSWSLDGSQPSTGAGERRVQGWAGLGWPEADRTVVTSSACGGRRERLPRPAVPAQRPTTPLCVSLCVSRVMPRPCPAILALPVPPGQGDGHARCPLAASGGEPVCRTVGQRCHFRSLVSQPGRRHGNVAAPGGSRRHRSGDAP